FRKGGDAALGKADRLSWPAILDHAKEIVESYDTPVTLRQLFYRLVADGTLPNLKMRYSQLSHHSAIARRGGDFPALLDRSSGIERYKSFTTPASAVEYAALVYRRDRTEGQEWTVYLGVEKAGMSAQLASWFTEPMGVPHIALGGYASQALCDLVRGDVARQDRQAVLIYAGDHDPSGEDIDRDLEARTGCFDKVIRVALTPGQVEQYDLPENSDPEVMEKLGKDTRADAFKARNGNLVQYEVDALPPDVLRGLYQDAIDKFWDSDAYESSLEREEEERGRLEELVDLLGD
ncbi:MAG: hypothetical protein ACRDID_00665, partial [Ktedonobacterales bacterium]